MYQRNVFERYLTLDEERRLLATVAKFAGALAQRDSAWMRLLRHSGLRVGSLAVLTVLDARRALKEGYLFVRSIKGSAAGSIYLNKKARQALHDLLRVRRAQGYPEHPDAPLVMSRNHRGMSVRSFQARMSQWCTQAGLDVDASPHWWRHTLGKRLMAQSTSADPRAIAQRALLHANINTSVVYTMPDREDYEQAMEEAG